MGLDASALTTDGPIPLDTSCGDQLVGAALCEPFEDPALVGMYRRETHGEISVGDQQVYRGGGALRATTVPGEVPSEAQVGATVFDGVGAGVVQARAYVYVPSSVAVTEVSILGLSEKDAPYHGASVALTADGAVRLDVTAAASNTTSAYELPRDRWVCLVLEVAVGASGSAAVHVDGATRVFAQDIDTLPAGGYESVTAGILWAPEGQGPAEIFVDELVADTGPVPCD
ncbi:MAG TPA: hypothetical protein VMZ28_04875 [Kofleriaceae bacterium]|nr:hypothetical protein [Kofleriaceae bacterium]